MRFRKRRSSSASSSPWFRPLKAGTSSGSSLVGKCGLPFIVYSASSEEEDGTSRSSELEGQDRPGGAVDRRGGNEAITEVC